MTLRSVLAAVAENVVAPLLVYGVLTLCGLGVVAALLGAAAFSALVVGVRVLRTGTVPVLGALVGVKFLLGVAIAAITGDPRLMLAKEALSTLVSSGIFTGSLLAATPMLARIHRDFVADPGTFDRYWRDDAGFRADHARMTAVWAAGLLVASATVVLVSYLPPLTTAVVLSQLVDVPVYLGLIGWTVRRFRRRSPELYAAPGSTPLAAPGRPR